MKSVAPLSEQETLALELAKRQGGKLHRNEAGWGPEEFDGTPAGIEHIYSAVTVKALVARGVMRWSLHDRRAGSTFPIEATVIEGVT